MQSNSIKNLTGKTEDTQNVNSAKKSVAAFRTISEVADELDVQQHVLRFWETKFSHVKPMKRGGGRRFYRPEDVELLKAIHTLLYKEGYTIKGVQKLLAGSKNKVLEKLNELDDNEPMLKADVKTVKAEPTEKETSENKTVKPDVKAEVKQELRDMLAELKSLRSMLHA